MVGVDSRLRHSDGVFWVSSEAVGRANLAPGKVSRLEETRVHGEIDMEYHLRRIRIVLYEGNGDFLWFSRAIRRRCSSVTEASSSTMSKFRRPLCITVTLSLTISGAESTFVHCAGKPKYKSHHEAHRRKGYHLERATLKK